MEEKGTIPKAVLEGRGFWNAQQSLLCSGLFAQQYHGGPSCAERFWAVFCWPIAQSATQG